ncbi:MAG: hypothetical protein KAW16_00040, partial [candidate division Zixibacteria bacterium]|nr:hypothetical protein [candidate division Zixibacteria bacterium]
MSGLDKSRSKEAQRKASLGETEVPQVHDKRSEDKGEKVKLDDMLTEMESIFEQVKSAQPRLESEEVSSLTEDSARVRRDDL